MGKLKIYKQHYIKDELLIECDKTNYIEHGKVDNDMFIQRFK